METSTILYCKDRLQEQLQKAKDSLKGVDNNLKKFISRTGSETSNRFGRNQTQTNEKWKLNRGDTNFNNNFRDRESNSNNNFRESNFNNNFRDRESNFNNNFRDRETNFNNNFRRRPANVLGDDIENIPVKRRLGPKILHSSISGPPRKSEDYDDEVLKKPTVSSCVIAKPHVLPPRKEAVAVKTYTETRARDRRMFGALLGTLQKFRQEETQLKSKEDKKAEVEQRLEDAARREKEKIRLERKKLVDFRKQRESYIKAVENNLKLVKEQEQWEELHQPLFNYIQTDAQPVICYLPKIHTEKTTELLEQCKAKLTGLIEEKRESVKEEVEALIEQYQNVDVDELLGKEPAQSPRHEEDNFRDQDDADEHNYDKNGTLARSSQDTNNVVNNGSWSADDGSQSWRADNSSDLHSGKEQRIKRKITSGISIKEEKEDDYEFQQEKDTPKSVYDEEKDNAEDKEDDDEASNNEGVSKDDDDRDVDKSPGNLELEADRGGEF